MALIAVITYGTLTAMAIGLAWLIGSTAKTIITDIREGN